MSQPPAYDALGLHILDPKDSRGYKSRYITSVQETALTRHIPNGDGAIAVDLGCGFGRLTPLLQEKGWRAIGIDPSEQLIEYARNQYPGPEYRVGGLPALPAEPGSIGLLLLQNVLRPLKMMERLDVVGGLGRYLAANATVVVVDNIRLGHPAFLSEAAIVDLMEWEGLGLVRKVPMRAARWWAIYLIRFGLIPERLLPRLAKYELDRMAQKTGAPRWQYWNVLFVFEKRS